MTRRRFILALVLPLTALLLFAGLVASYEYRQPPLEKLGQALDSLESARRARAERLASSVFQEARRHLSAGEQAMSSISASWWPFCSYRVADSLFTESIRLSRLAESRAEDSQARRNNNVKSDIARLSDSLATWREILDYALPQTENELLYRAASFSLHMARNLLGKKQHESAGEYADSVRVILSVLQKRYQQHSSSSEQWVRLSKDWAARTVEKSKTSGKTALIVDKSKHRLYLLSAGKIVDSLACELGYNSGHQKRMSGDGATPEGMYRVTKVNRQSKYYRALLLDYPNADDRKRFQSSLEAGTIPADSKIGGLIEIHGHGGQGRDWTDGCVAVTDSQMDKLLRVAANGTPVTIVRVWEKR